jgi:LacI family transcriptional regulator, galactose operon repressor
MTVTIKDVAREAGVSVATVSRALNGKELVRDTTRRRVRDVAARLRYAPHGAAQSLITNRTHTVGVLLPELYGEFFSEVIRGIDQTSRCSGFHVLLSSSHSDRTEVEAAFRAMRGRVDGLVIMTPDIDAAALETNLPAGLPVVLLNNRVDGDGFASVEVDNHGGAYAMVRHLIGLGHRRIALIRGAARNRDASERQRGYRDAMRDLGGEWSPALELEGDFTEQSGHAAGVVLAGLSDRPTAVFAANDSMAIGALSALLASGLSVPGEIAVTGFDDIPIARYVSPPLTSVHVPISELGTRAMALLLSAVEEGVEGPRHETLATRLVVRASCGVRSEAS